MIKSTLLVIAFLFVGCTTPGAVYIEEQNIAITDLQKVVADSTPIRVRNQSRNGRQYHSAYFIVVEGEFKEARSEPKRYSSIITILGDRRPYEIEVQVVAEGRDSSGRYSVIANDVRLARVISRRVQKALHQRREDRNIIDDFRVF